MGKKGNPALIGAFVVGAVALFVIGLVLFGSGRLFKQTQEYVLFFPGAVDGLNVGAPVKFKGVEIGSVKNISIRLAGTNEELNAERVAQGIRIPVIIELDSEKMTQEGTRKVDRKRLQHLIDLGLRAQLNAQSLVTGLLFVQLNFYPDMPPTFVLPPDGDHLPEIPTIPTRLEQVQTAAEGILRKLEEIKFEKMVVAIESALAGVDQLVNSPDLRAAIEKLPGTVGNLNEMIADARGTLARLDRESGALIAELKDASNKTDLALEQARATMQTVQTLVDPSSPLAKELLASLQEVAGAARSLRLLADTLERNPSALVRGKDVSNP